MELLNFYSIISENREKSSKTSNIKKNHKVITSTDLSKSSITHPNKRATTIPTTVNMNKSHILFNNTNPGNNPYKERPLIIRIADVGSILNRVFQPLKNVGHLDNTYTYIKGRKLMLNNTQTSGFGSCSELVNYFNENNLNISVFAELFNNIDNNFSEVDKTNLSFSVVIVKASDITKIDRVQIGPYEEIESTKSYLFIIADKLVEVQTFLNDVFVFSEGTKNNEETNLINLVVTRKLDTMVEELKSYDQYLYLCRATRIIPMKFQHGLFCINNKGVCEFLSVTNNFKKKSLKFHLNDIRALVKYRYLMQYKSINIILFSRKRSKIIDFENESEFQNVYDYLKDNSPKLDKSYTDIRYHTNMWVDGLMSNYDYIMHLNTMSCRSFVDLSQYPIMPWVIINYEDEEGNYKVSLF